MTAAPIPAASVLLARDPGVSEVFVVRRAESLRFLGGFWAFPGGKVHSTDADLRAAAARELFEETGVLVARRVDGTFPDIDSGFVQARHDLLAGTLDWTDLLTVRELRIDPADFLHIGSLVTPSFSPVRFDTAFFVATRPCNQEPEIWPGELTEGVWGTPEELLADWTRVGRLLSPPTVSLLEIARGKSLDELPKYLASLLGQFTAGALSTIWFSPAVAMIPVRSQALPPSTHTNVFLVGTDRLYLLDPGAVDPDEQERLFTALDNVLAGRHMTAVVLTHHHPDHIGAATVSAQRYGVPILAHATTADLLAGTIKVEQTLKDGDQLELGVAPDDSGPWHLEAVFTPGHASGHLCFYEKHYGLLFAGDMVSTLSSVVIAPPEGDLTQYLASLRRLQELPARLLLPSHGSASTRPAHILAESLSHRKAREEQLLAALAGGGHSVPELARKVYRGLPAALMHFAEYQVLAGLQKLEREGRASHRETGWVLLTI